MKTADMLSLFFSFCDFIGIVTGLKIDPIDHIKKKAIELPLKEFEKWKDTAVPEREYFSCEESETEEVISSLMK